jgi:hypothetical protein
MGPIWLSVPAWCAACLDKGIMSGTEEASEKAWQRIRHGLSASGWIEILENQVRIL